MHNRLIAVAAFALSLLATPSAAAQGGGFGTAGEAPFALQGRVYFIPEERERLPIQATGHGEAHPRVPNDSDRTRAQNRRIEITVTPP